MHGCCGRACRRTVPERHSDNHMDAPQNIHSLVGVPQFCSRIAFVCSAVRERWRIASRYDEDLDLLVALRAQHDHALVALAVGGLGMRLGESMCYTVFSTELYDFIYADRCPVSLLSISLRMSCLGLRWPTCSAAFQSSAHWNIDIQFFVVYILHYIQTQ